MEFAYRFQRIAVRLEEEQLGEVLFEDRFLVFAAQSGVDERPVHGQRVEQVVELVLDLIVLWKEFLLFSGNSFVFMQFQLTVGSECFISSSKSFSFRFLAISSCFSLVASSCLVASLCAVKIRFIPSKFSSSRLSSCMLIKGFCEIAKTKIEISPKSCFLFSHPRNIRRTLHAVDVRICVGHIAIPCGDSVDKRDPTVIDEQSFHLQPLASDARRLQAPDHLLAIEHQVVVDVKAQRVERRGVVVG